MGYQNAPDVPGRPSEGTGPAHRRLASRCRDDRGQSLVVIVIAMALILAVAAFAIDASEWFAKHHQAQVSADAAALAAANCLAMHKCSSATPSGDAGMTATNYAITDGVTIPSGDIHFDSTNKNVTVTTSTAAPDTFAKLFGIHPTVSARAVATWGYGILPYSLYAENQTCGVGTVSNNPLGLYMSGTGGGGNTVYGLFANGEYFNSDNSNNTFFLGVVHADCGTGTPPQTGGCQQQSQSVNCWTNNSTVNMQPSAQPYPLCYSEPGVTSTSSLITGYCQTAPADPGPSCTYPPDGYWTTSTSAPAGDQITAPGVYCIGSSATGPSTTFSGTCTNVTATSHTVGSIWVDTTSASNMTSSSGYEFVGPCVYLTTTSSGTLSGPSGAPLVYGTTGATGGPGCSSCNTGTPDVILNPSGQTFGSTIFDPLGTCDVSGQNGSFIGFVEAQNIVDSGNNGIFGNGPSGNNEPDGDSLTG